MWFKKVVFRRTDPLTGKPDRRQMPMDSGRGSWMWIVVSLWILGIRPSHPSQPSTKATRKAKVHAASSFFVELALGTDKKKRPMPSLEEGEDVDQ